MTVGQLLYAQETLIVEQCYKCQCFFAISQDLYRRAKDDSKNSFFCPHGHEQSYVKSETSRLKEQVEQLERQKNNLNEVIDIHKRTIEQLGYSVRAQKAAKTKIINRVKNGVCPCCNRTFSNLQNHFKTKHPELLEV